MHASQTRSRFPEDLWGWVLLGKNQSNKVVSQNAEMPLPEWPSAFVFKLVHNSCAMRTYAVLSILSLVRVRLGSDLSLVSVCRIVRDIQVRF